MNIQIASDRGRCSIPVLCFPVLMHIQHGIYELRQDGSIHFLQQASHAAHNVVEACFADGNCIEAQCNISLPCKQLASVSLVGYTVTVDARTNRLLFTKP